MGSAVDTLIDAAYATALDYRVSKSFAAAYSALAERDGAVDVLSTHIARARQIAASRSGEARLDLSNLTVCIDMGLTDAMPVDLGTMLPRLKHVSVPGRPDLVEPTDWRDLAQWALKLIPGDAGDALFSSFMFKDGQRQHAILKRARTLASEPEKLRVIFPSLQSAPGRGEPELLQRMLGLTIRQAEIAQRIAQGQSAAEIANEMGIRVNTVRDHIKAIYERTDINKQTDLAVLVGELNLMATTLSSPGPAQSKRTREVHQRMTNFFWTKDGRRVCYSDCGDHHGRVILKTHSSFGGRWVWEPTAETLYRYGLRLLIIERPGVGLTDPTDKNRDSTVVSDAIAMLDHLGVSKAYGFGTSGGAFHLADMIAAHPRRFSGATFISARAFEVESDAAETDYVAQVASLPLEAGALIMESIAASQTDEGWRSGIRSVLERNPVDLAALEDEVLMDMHVRQQKSATCNGFGGQLLEWRRYGESLHPPKLPGLPYAVIVGAEDDLAHVRKGTVDWSNHLGVEPETVDGAGHLIFLTHTHKVLMGAGLISRG